MNYANIKNYDIANGIGVRVSLFVSGCRNHCPNCFNKETWDFNYGKPFTESTANTILDYLSKSYITGLTILGGEPFEPENQEELLNFIKLVKKTFNNKSIWMYSGFTYEQMFAEFRCNTPFTKEILNNIDVLVDGRFVEELKDITLKFKGSANQRVIDMKSTIKNNCVTILEL